MQNLISVIIPVYNLQDLIASCLLCLQAQTYPDWEAVCVDDGSTDGSGDTIRAMAADDPRIRYIRQENAGVSAARNTGLAQANGDYICFLDGDDLLHPQALELLLAAIDGYDIAISDYWAGSERKIDSPQYSTPERTEIDLPAFYALKGNHDISNTLSRTVCGKLYRKPCACAFSFPVGACYSEDMHYIGKVMTLHPRMCFLDLPLYYYYKRPSSIIHAEFSEKKFTCTQTLDALCTFLQSKNETYLLGQYLCNLYSALICIRTDSIGTPFKKRAFRDCRRIGGKWLGAWLRNPTNAWKTRLIYFVSFLSERAYELGRIRLDPSLKEIYRAQHKAERDMRKTKNA